MFDGILTKKRHKAQTGLRACKQVLRESNPRLASSFSPENNSTPGPVFGGQSIAVSLCVLLQKKGCPIKDQPFRPAYRGTLGSRAIRVMNKSVCQVVDLSLVGLSPPLIVTKSGFDRAIRVARILFHQLMVRAYHLVL